MRMVTQDQRSMAISRCSAVRLSVPLAALAAVLLVGPIDPTLAQQAGGEPEYSFEAVAFDAADTDGDGVVSEAELARDAAHGFAALDKDGSGTLTPQELAPHDPALFSKVDTNRDGLLTFKEVMTNKLRAFKAGDKNHDGGLSFEEMVEIVEIETGGAS
jgi:Ca2+-binding EF-hand superfamily protein